MTSEVTRWRNRAISIGKLETRAIASKDPQSGATFADGNETPLIAASTSAVRHLRNRTIVTWLCTPLGAGKHDCRSYVSCRIDRHRASYDRFAAFT